MTIFFTRLLELLILPPAGPLLMVVAGLLIPYRRKHWRRALLGVGLFTLYLFMLPVTTGWLMSVVEVHPPLHPDSLQQLDAGAIVVLGGGRYEDGPEYGGSTSNAVELERLRYAAFVHLRTGLPIAVVGGDGLRTGIAEADLMQAVLTREFRVPVRWNDGRSTNTIDNARFAWEVLSAQGIERIVLVTHASHMRRAAALFQRAGFEVIPGPTSFYRPGTMESGWLSLLPHPGSMRLNDRALHELLGLMWNRVVL